MEKTIDRSEYRRSYKNVQDSDKNSPKKKYKILSMFLNQIIVSLLIIILLFTLKYLDKSQIINYIKENTKGDIQITNVIAKFKEIINQNFINAIDNIIVEEKSGEALSGESGYITAVEGVNQMREDENYIKENFKLIPPTTGTITSKFGCRKSDDIKISSYHSGLDIANVSGTKIIASHDGKVIKAGEYGTYGNCIMIQKDNLITLYAHCDRLLISKDTQIQKGDTIATMGSTGNATGSHLHFEIRYDDRLVDPQNVICIEENK